MSTSIVIYILITALVSVPTTLISTLFVEALKKPYPVTRFDHYIRMHLRKGKIKGSNLTYRTNFEINNESIQGVLNYLKGNVKRGEFYDLINVSFIVKEIYKFYGDC